MSWKKFLFSVEGRFNRAKYWQFILYYVLFSLAAVAVIFAIGALAGDVAMVIALLIFGVILGVPMLVATVVVAIKRMHDRNKSGWWLLLFFLVPGILGEVAEPISPATGEFSLPGTIGVLAALVLWIWGFVELAVLRGTRGNNDYGPDPLADSAKTASAFS